MMTTPSPTIAPQTRTRTAPWPNGSILIRGFQTLHPRFRSPQETLQNELIKAHARSGNVSPKTLRALFDRYSASPEKIAFRGHEAQFLDLDGSDVAKKTAFFDQAVRAVFERFYPPLAAAPDSIVHVTCTGYCAPSGAQRLVSLRRWGRQTQVLHAYHMGCYAAHPAIRMAAALATSSRTRGSVDVVHTELCSLHMDPTNHDASQLVIQSLFADGFIKYQLDRTGSDEMGVGTSDAFELIHVRDEIIPESSDTMGWSIGPLVFNMTLSKEVPPLFALALPRFVSSLMREAGFDWEVEKPGAIVAIHPGGPLIIEMTERALQLTPAQVAASRRVLREHGNMSSATLPVIWQNILHDARIPDGTLVVSLGAGPGLTLSGALLRKRNAL